MIERNEVIGKQMKAVRLARKLSQKQLASMLNIRPEQYNRIERGTSFTTFEVALLFCKLFDCEIIIRHE